MIHPTAVVGHDVRLADDVSVGPFAVILGPTIIGAGSSIGAAALIGGPPEVSSLAQRRGWMGEVGYEGVRIGSNVVIRERAVIHQGSVRETCVGDGSWILNGAYLAHDVRVGDRVTVSAGVSIGGHAEIDDDANIGMNAAIHQRRIVGRGAMVGMSTPLTCDVPPFAKIFGSPPRVRGANTVALGRAGVDAQDESELKRVFETGDLRTLGSLSANSPSLMAAMQWWSERADRHPGTAAETTR
jgi:UDP-N-acetylglucosamine acyltransferase